MQRRQVILTVCLIVLGSIAILFYSRKDEETIRRENLKKADDDKRIAKAAQLTSAESLRPTVAKLIELGAIPHTYHQPTDLEQLGKRVGLTVDNVVFRSAGAISPETALLLEKLPDLEAISFYDQPLKDGDLAMFKSLKLKRLDFNYTLITDVGLEHLPSFPELSELRLNGTKVTDQGLEKISKLPKLNMLMLYGTSVSDAGIAHLHGVSNLQDIDLQHTKVTQEGIAALRKSLPNCRVHAEPY